MRIGVHQLPPTPLTRNKTGIFNLKQMSMEVQNGNIANAVLCAGILDVLRNDWGNRCGEFEAYWFGYEALKDELHERLIYVDVATIKSAMKELSKQNKVELRPTYDENWKISGRGWFACA